MTKFHRPVMPKEVIEYLNLRPGITVVDATIGTAGHALEILKRIRPDGRLIGIDRDAESLAISNQRLNDFKGNFELIHDDFRNIDNILDNLGIEKLDAVLFDLGISSFQLEKSERGFSFRMDGPLDMRMDRSSYISAYDLVNNLNEDEISSILWSFGQERWHNRIAHLLIEERQKNPIASTRQLSNIILRAVPYAYRHNKIHVATRTFQAIRIAVNRELEALKGALLKAVEQLKTGGRICVISFHSLEDRIVKLEFRRCVHLGKLSLINSKPLIPSEDERSDNPLSRSAKLRCAERL